ncbi:hypothetical protein QQP08_004918 [Theobroma cacao]|nr:hypothetical protein QQP08_004918 [Theobroma cacao]
MAKREQMIKPNFLLLAVLVLFMMFQCKVASSSRFSWSCDPACQMELTRTRKLLDMQQKYSGDVPSPADYDYNDFYRRQGDVPSPGVGH